MDEQSSTHSRMKGISPVRSPCRPREVRFALRSLRIKAQNRSTGYQIEPNVLSSSPKIRWHPTVRLVKLKAVDGTQRVGSA